MLDFFKQPIPWYVAGPLIGLTVPALLILGNKTFGISSSLRHVCASCFPGDISFFNYNWKKEIWNLFFVAGIILGGFIAAKYMSNPNPIEVSEGMKQTFAQYGITDFSGLVPNQIFNWNELLTFKGLSMMILGGFLVGFGTRYAGGCTLAAISTLLAKAACSVRAGRFRSNASLGFTERHQ
jgi:uncharacterized membrane protein YedE/YeeE